MGGCFGTKGAAQEADPRKDQETVAGGPLAMATRDGGRVCRGRGRLDADESHQEMHRPKHRIDPGGTIPHARTTKYSSRIRTSRQARSDYQASLFRSLFSETLPKPAITYATNYSQGLENPCPPFDFRKYVQLCPTTAHLQSPANDIFPTDESSPFDERTLCQSETRLNLTCFHAKNSKRIVQLVRRNMTSFLSKVAPEFNNYRMLALSRLQGRLF